MRRLTYPSETLLSQCIPYVLILLCFIKVAFWTILYSADGLQRGRALRAYGLAYILTTGPRLLKLPVLFFKRRTDEKLFLTSLCSILLSSFSPRSFTTFCGVLVGGYTFLQMPFQILYHYTSTLLFRKALRWPLSESLKIRTARFAAAFFSAWFSVLLLNLPKRTKATKQQTSGNTLLIAKSKFKRPDLQAKEGDLPRNLGRTVDLTLFAATRAIETLVVNIWRHRAKRRHEPTHSRATFIFRHTDTWIFAISSGTIMWSWFYFPEALPRAYNKWIGEVAQVDFRLIEILRKARAGDFVYGENKGEQALVLQSMCKEYDWPLCWGDGEKTIPIPCEMVHMGTGPNCHWHAAIRFSRAFRFAMATNLPLQLLVKVLAKKQFSAKAVNRAFRTALQSSAFLGAFVTLMYYGICLSRTQIGPRIVSRSIVTPQMWDSGLCIRAACILCGWSILVEAEKRRQELAMFVAPRALATILPRGYDPKYFWRERTVFSLSIAVLFTFAQQDSKTVRGMLGMILHQILQEKQI